MRAVVGADALDISASKLVSVSDDVAFAILRIGSKTERR
jgi:hypothetical protein